MFLFCLGKFFHAFPHLAEFSQGRGRRIPWEKTKAQYLNIKQVYKFLAESTKELKPFHYPKRPLPPDCSRIYKRIETYWFVGRMHSLMACRQNLQKN